MACVTRCWEPGIDIQIAHRTDLLVLIDPCSSAAHHSFFHVIDSLAALLLLSLAVIEKPAVYHLNIPIEVSLRVLAPQEMTPLNIPLSNRVNC